ncbi:MAG: MFS transporter [Gemmatimonadaceae bacterium]|nr:MFS transporter [Gemmatimonadaceae bacterium]
MTPDDNTVAAPASPAPATSPPPSRRSWLAKVGLDRPDLRAWAMYDWAVSSFQTTIQVAVFQIYFVSVAAADLPGSRGTQAWANANTIASILVAIVSPVLGAISDVAAAKKRMLAIFMLLGVAACGGMYFIQRGDYVLASTLYILATVGATASVVFYEALLPHLSRPEEMDRVSSAGYALGYVGGGVLLALNLAWILAPQAFDLPHGDAASPEQKTLPARLAFVSVAVWWFVFSLPILRRVREPARTMEPDEASTGINLFVTPFRRMGETVRELRTFKHAFLMLLAFLVYNDGIQTIIRMATAYGTELGIPSSALTIAILIVQFVGIPFAFLFGMLADRIGAKQSVFLGLLAYAAISVTGYYMKTARDFYMLAFLVGMVQGGTQALSRSLFASLIPAHKSGEFFGFYSVFEKFSSIFGPLLFSITIAMTGSSRNAILGVIIFFAVGAAILARVNVAEGRQMARDAERDLVRVNGAG